MCTCTPERLSNDIRSGAIIKFCNSLQVYVFDHWKEKTFSSRYKKVEAGALAEK